MRRALLSFLFAAGAAVPASATDVRLGLMGGASLLESKDTSLSHAALTDEVTLGRSVLGGLAIELDFGRDRLAFEGTIGPYHNDVDRSCIETVPGPTQCVPEPSTSTSHVLFYAMHYRHLFGEGGWRPSLGLGLGGKRYSFKEDFLIPPETSPTFEASLGAETAGRTAFRVEARGVYSTNNPLIQGRSQFELQLRASVLFGAGR
jgi:hypothetical protein